MTLDAVPPGQQPTRMTPNANSFGSAKAHTSNHANRGMIVNCAKQPMRISNGLRSTIRKSDGERVSPMPNMMTPSMGLMTGVSIHTKEAGFSSDTAAANNTNTPIHRAMKSHIFFKGLFRY